MNVGRLLAAGRTSQVFEYGSDSVVKVPLQSTPDEWLISEANVAEAIQRAGAPAPVARGVVMVDGRPSFVSQRIRGSTLWRNVVERPQEADRWASVLAELHLRLFEIDPPPSIPRFVDRTLSKLKRAEMLSTTERSEANALLTSLPDRSHLLHGDLHPANVIMGSNGPVVVDWFDAAVGHPAADIARTWIMMAPPRTSARLAHMPEGTAKILDPLRRRYVDVMSIEWPGAAPHQNGWLPVVAASRLAERVSYQTTELLEMWDHRSGESSDTSIPK